MAEMCGAFQLTKEQSSSVKERVYNFSAGPCALPLEVLVEAQNDMISYKGTGMSVMEMSHRGKTFVNIAQTAEKDLRDILGVPANYKIFFQQGGATLQFAGVPLNMLGEQGSAADYLITGQWGEKAHKECGKYGKANAACNTKSTKFTSIPNKSEWNLSPDAKYVHYCMNETVNGVEFKEIPDVGPVPLVADMSSNFMSRPIQADKHSFIYAGIQKNLGPAGMCVCIADEKVMGKAMNICPSYMDWKACSDAESMANTPACYSWYMMGLYLKYTKEKGGVAYWDELSEKKSQLIYGAIDDSNGFYTAPVDKECRSRMNVPFQIMGGNDELEKKFLSEAQKVKLFTLAGHRSVGGCRASLYNGMPMEGVETLRDFMKSFAEENAQ
jgi:phosphoserine aminotransferase